MEKDWRQNGDYLVDVQDQENCNCCWAIVACNAISAAQRIHFGNPLVVYSYQQLIDCAKKEWKNIKDHECKLSSYTVAFEHIYNDGVAFAEHYPFQKKRNPCQLNHNRYVMIHGFEDLANDREGVLKAIDKQPVCAWIYITRGFKEFMGDDIYVRSEEDEVTLTKMTAAGKSQKHAVLIVGYGVVENKPYFLIQNSWNTTWGSNGYAKVERNLLNHFCYPNVENMKVAMGTDHYESTINGVKLRR